MTEIPFRLEGGHAFLDVEGIFWLLDTGSPSSFGATGTISLAGRTFRFGTELPGLDAPALSEFVGIRCGGLLGADVLGALDFVLDAREGTAIVSADPVPFAGTRVDLDMLRGIPILTARTGGAERRLFLDTGAQISYLPAPLLADHPPLGPVPDFYPGKGRFTTEAHRVPMDLGGAALSLRVGTTPHWLRDSPIMRTVDGILGSEFLVGRRIGYFPRRRELRMPRGSGSSPDPGPERACRP